MYELLEYMVDTQSDGKTVLLYISCTVSVLYHRYVLNGIGLSFPYQHVCGENPCIVDTLKV